MHATSHPPFSARLSRSRRGRHWMVVVVCVIAVGTFFLGRLLPECIRGATWALGLSVFPFVFIPVLDWASREKQDVVGAAVCQHGITANGAWLMPRRDILDAYVEPRYPETATVSPFGRARVSGRSTIVVVRGRKRTFRIKVGSEDTANALLAAIGFGARQAPVSFRGRRLGKTQWAIVSAVGTIAPALVLGAAFLRHDAKTWLAVPSGIAFSLILCVICVYFGLQTKTTAVIGPQFVQVPRPFGTPLRIPLAWVAGAHDNDADAVILLLRNGGHVSIRDESSKNRSAILARLDAIWYWRAK
jgi:hypothetical protein